MKPLRPLFMAVVLASAVSLSHGATRVIPPLPTTKPGSEAVLLGVDSVRKELHLTSLQRAVLNDIRTEYRDDARAIVAKVNAGKLSKAQAKSQLDALTASSNRRALRAFLGRVLLVSLPLRQRLPLTPTRSPQRPCLVLVFPIRRVWGSSLLPRRLLKTSRANAWSTPIRAPLA